MGEAGERVRFAAEAFTGFAGAAGDGEQLDRDIAVEVGVAGAPDLAHAASPDAFNEPIAPEGGSGSGGRPADGIRHRFASCARGRG